MEKIPPLIKQLGMWLVIGLRLALGLVVMKTGYDLAAGKLHYGQAFLDDPITPLFIIIVGAYFSFSSLFGLLFSKKS
ncbi:hypothetical protein [Desulfogranum marinum]|uniref:hypothetical protein n=1 Tax=Desulfogranum marinum TaxID=453220 RepID=UPI00196235CE|nr:hypothetical protein [Desulfogranum marinum]MBM9515066.1 hypothetical protein [Desulfogranum marinum]